MGKCFLGLGLGGAMALAWVVEVVCGPPMPAGARLSACLSGALEWLLVGACVTVCAVGGYALHRGWEAVSRRLAGGRAGE